MTDESSTSEDQDGQAAEPAAEGWDVELGNELPFAELNDAQVAQLFLDQAEDPNFTQAVSDGDITVASVYDGAQMTIALSEG
ncbi:MAG: hypothetical protein ACR2N4_15105 [Jatrophihabitans sp.]